MTPIEQVRPTQPGNWTRRPEERKRRGGNDAHDRNRKDEDRPRDRKDDDGGREHIVDELA